MTVDKPSPNLVLMVRDAAGRHCYNLTPQWHARSQVPSISSSGRSSVSSKSLAPRPYSLPQDPTAPHAMLVSHEDVNGFLLSSTELVPPVEQRSRSLSSEKQSQLLDRMCKQQLEVEQSYGLAMVRSKW
jgi:hypothetical protein